MSADTVTRRQAAASYLARGIAVIPVPAGEKNPNRPGWQGERLTGSDVPRCWTNGQNVGLLTGKPSAGRVDADLDADEAVVVAGRFLPPTLTSGRESRPHSHWWYSCPDVESKDWKDTDGSKLVELRSTGRQTLVWPSTHPSGDGYLWHGEGVRQPIEIGAVDLESRLRKLATTALLARHLPPLRDTKTGGGGGRHDYALALAGFLLRSGRMDEGLVLKILKAAWDAQGWPDDGSKREAHRDLEGIV